MCVLLLLAEKGIRGRRCIIRDHVNADADTISLCLSFFLLPFVCMYTQHNTELLIAENMEKLNHLTSLDLSHNLLVDVSNVQHLTRLTHLDLSYNRL